MDKKAMNDRCDPFKNDITDGNLFSALWSLIDISKVSTIL